MNILLTIDDKYEKIAETMLYSLKRELKEPSTVYLLSTDLSQEAFSRLQAVLEEEDFRMLHLQVEEPFPKARKTSRYPTTMYLRLLAYKFLPEDMDRILYLDPDIIVKGDLEELYYQDFGDDLYLATTHIHLLLRLVNSLRLLCLPRKVYPNTGVLMINLQELRRMGNEEKKLLGLLKRKKWLLVLPDQDILYLLHGNRIGMIDEMSYNLSDRILNLKRGKDCNLEKTRIVHYAGRNKPWKEDYKGELGQYWKQAEKELQEKKKKAFQKEDL